MTMRKKRLLTPRMENSEKGGTAVPYAKLKNLFILTLALVNAVLLCLVVPLHRERDLQQELAARRLAALFSEAGVEMDAEDLPKSRSLYTLEFSPGETAARPAMEALLGPSVREEADSTPYLKIYRSVQGECSLARGGALEAQLAGRLPRSDLRRAVQEELEAMGVAAVVSAPERASAGTYAVTAVQQLLEVPLFSAALDFTFRSGVLARVEGTVYFDTSALFRTDDVTCIAAADALVAFLGSRDRLGWVGKAVTGVTQGYLRAETASAAVVRLVPGWRVDTDTGAFWVNGVTREVSAFA